MNSKFFFVLFLLSPALLWAGDDLDKKIIKLLNKEFIEEYKVIDTSFELTEEKVKVIEEKSRIKIHYNHFRLIKVFQNDTMFAKGIIIKLPSKVGNISVLTLTDKEGFIINIKIVNADDSKGYSLNSKLWRKQFTNKKKSDLLRVGKDIDAMSGATISSNAATKAIKLSLFLLTLTDDPKIIPIP